MPFLLARFWDLRDVADGGKQQNRALIDEEAGLVEYKDTGIVKVVKVVSTLLASLLVTMPMIALYFVHNIEKRLGIVTGSTMLFSLASVNLRPQPQTGFADV